MAESYYNGNWTQVPSWVTPSAGVTVSLIGSPESGHYVSFYLGPVEDRRMKTETLTQVEAVKGKAVAFAETYP